MSNSERDPEQHPADDSQSRRSSKRKWVLVQLLVAMLACIAAAGLIMPLIEIVRDASDRSV
jgi:hypothetical protein